MQQNKYASDWLASNPLFFNETTAKVSDNVNDVIEWRDVELDPEGLNNYLDFGYSVFGQTPVKHVKFLLPNQEMTVEGRKIKIEQLDDPVDKFIGRETNEEEILELIRSRVQNWENKNQGEIVIPTSGGYDSRLLNIFVGNKSRIRSFTYGVSENQAASFEVTYAKELSKRLGIRWQQIELGEYHRYFDEWDDQYGISTHAHGMYHIEFYKKILRGINSPQMFLSGIIGDGWSGNVEIEPIDDVGDINMLGYSHEMHADSQFSLLKSDGRLKQGYFDANKERLSDPQARIIESMRMKMVLLSYLVRLPSHFGFEAYSPFLDIEVAMGMLNLPEDRRKNRVWQTDYLIKLGFDFENQKIKADRHNTLNLQAMEKIRPKMLDPKLMSEVIGRGYIEEINREMAKIDRFPVYRVIQNLADNFGLPVHVYSLASKAAMAYNAYLTLKPLESLFIKRNKYG